MTPTGFSSSLQDSIVLWILPKRSGKSTERFNWFGHKDRLFLSRLEIPFILIATFMDVVGEWLLRKCHIVCKYWKLKKLCRRKEGSQEIPAKSLSGNTS
jgi:hypothetical protein